MHARTERTHEVTQHEHTLMRTQRLNTNRNTNINVNDFIRNILVRSIYLHAQHTVGIVSEMPQQRAGTTALNRDEGVNDMCAHFSVYIFYRERLINEIITRPEIVVTNPLGIFTGATWRITSALVTSYLNSN